MPIIRCHFNKTNFYKTKGLFIVQAININISISSIFIVDAISFEYVHWTTHLVSVWWENFGHLGLSQTDHLYSALKHLKWRYTYCVNIIYSRTLNVKYPISLCIISWVWITYLDHCTRLPRNFHHSSQDRLRRILPHTFHYNNIPGLALKTNVL